MRISLFVLCLMAGTAQAQDWNLRDDDAILTPEEISAEIVGATLTFYDNGQSKFEADGSYSYTYHQGGTAYGEFEIGENGQICIAYQNGWSRCDTYVRNGDRLVVLTEKGERYPVRP